MDAHTFGAFVARCRKEKGMTQAELAAKIQVTDKAVSRWERGIGFPDIHTIEPLADALGISVLELMKSEKLTDREIGCQDADEAVVSTLEMAKLQQKQERKTIFSILGIVAAAVVLILLLDSTGWEPEKMLLLGAGIGFPLFCLCGSVVLLGYGIWRRTVGRKSGQTFLAATLLLLVLALFFVLFFLAGVLGAGPVPS